jgi:hypothetical protein
VTVKLGIIESRAVDDEVRQAILGCCEQRTPGRYASVRDALGRYAKKAR